jgi:hypothetical protein
MVGTRRVVPGFVLGAVVMVVIIAASPIGRIGPLGAAGKAQLCDRPAPPTQSGRATVAPGLNASKSPQQIALTISLFSCSPARSTRGAGTLKSAITIKAAQTCALLGRPHILTGKTTIVWKAEFTSTLAVSFSFSGTSHNVTATGKVTKGLFKNHPFSGRFHFTEAVSGHGGTPGNSDIAKACKNRTAPNRNGRLSISGLTFVTTKPFVIT